MTNKQEFFKAVEVLNKGMIELAPLLDELDILAELDFLEDEESREEEGEGE